MDLFEKSLLVILIAGVVVILISLFPELRRYLRMRSM